MPGLTRASRQRAQTKPPWIAGSSPGDDVEEMRLEKQLTRCYNSPMDTDDIAPPPKKARSFELGQDLSKLSVVELRAVIEDLKAEIARVEQVFSAKQSSKSAAESVFKR